MQKLEALDDQYSKIPFAYDGQVLGSLREDQVPKFFGALTDTEALPVKWFDLSSLTAMQNRVSTGKVEAIRNSDDATGKKPLVVINGDKRYLADGHHRAVATWLDGNEQLEAHYKDITEENNMVKSVEVFKSSDELRLVFGYASVIEKDGSVVVDTQQDTIDSEELLKSITAYMSGGREAKMMHAGGKIGEVIHSFPMTPDIAKSLGVEASQYGWIVGMKVHDDAVWNMVKNGDLKSFSIGGKAKRIEI